MNWQWIRQTMRKKQESGEFDDVDMEQLLSHKKQEREHCRRRRRRQWLMETGRVVDVPVSPPLNLIILPQQHETTAIETKLKETFLLRARRGGIVEQVLLWVEISTIFAFIVIGLTLWNTVEKLNEATTRVQRAQSQAIALPTPTISPVIDVVVLPSGHNPPVAGRVSEPGEAGNIPAHLLPAINAYVPPPIPTPSPVQARRIQIPSIDVDAPVVQGMYDWEQLKRGVAQKIDSAAPGEVGNMALAAHNDIYGEIFRDLDRLTSGDEIIVSTGARSYTYIVREIRIVKPTEVSVLEATNFASTTLISCYPYRINTQRIVVFADLIET